jgi:hypothetical protein
MARRVQRQQVAAILFFASALATRSAEPVLSPEQQAVMNHISANSLRGNVSFLASDLLEGRATPSRGLDLAAEYLAAQFRRAGLEPAGDDGYFQTAAVTVREPNFDGFTMAVTAGGRTMEVAKNEVSLAPASAIQFDNAPLVVIDGSQPVTAADINGKVVLVTAPRAARLLQGTEPALRLTAGRLPASGQQVLEPESGLSRFPAGLISKPDLAAFLKGATDARITVHVAAAKEHAVKVRNVAAILRGSDPQLRDTFVMLTSHYDHVGLAASGEDRIFNGANDDASGTSSVLEIATALAAMPVHPQRSVLFVLFFGEETGLWGSRYYGRHPLVPPAKTIADLNLEQMGRTDATEGRQIKTASITGFDFSDIPRILAEAAQLAGVRVYKNAAASDAFFDRSDNQSLADLGVPAHTLCVAFDFPDYHKVTDSWEKIDYDNMAAVDRAVALGVLHMASGAAPPRWNESYAPARKYADAARKLIP